VSYDLATFTRTARPINYLGFDHASHSYALLPHGSFVRTYVGEFFDRPNFNQQRLNAFLNLGMSEPDFLDDARWQQRLDVAARWCQERGFTPLACGGGDEENYWRCQALTQTEMSGWACFRGMSDYDRIRLVRDRMARHFELCKLQWPGIYTVMVEAAYTDEELPGFGGYGPVPDHCDVLGVSYYMAPGSVGFVPDTTQGQLDLFYRDVGRRVEHAAGYNLPVLVIAQAFSDQLWPRVSPGQLDWWYRLAQRTPEVQALMFFCAESVPAARVIGLDTYADLASQVGSISSYNAGLLT
jgi:hypothetical protein